MLQANLATDVFNLSINLWWFFRIPELPADPGGQQHHSQHRDLYGRLPAEAPGIHDGLLLALLGQGHY